MAFDAEKTLRIRWSKAEKDWMIDYPSKATGWLAHSLIEGRTDFTTFIQELKERGYDTDTLRLLVHKREFICMKEYKKDGEAIFQKDEVYRMKQDKDGIIGITDHKGYSYYFSKYRSEEEYDYLYDYFNEKKKP